MPSLADLPTTPNAPNGIEPCAYAEWRAPAHLARYVACTFRSSPAGNQAASAEPVMPDGCIDIIWDGGQLMVAGPDTQPVWSLPTGPSVIGLRFKPGMGPIFFDIPGNLLCDQRVGLDALWKDSERIADALAACSDQRECAEALLAAVARRLAIVDDPDPMVEAAVGVWAANASSLSTNDIAKSAGLTPRQVHRRFLSAVGYGPKFLQRVLRFQAFLGSCRDGRLGLAELASASGYADQAHLTREARLLAGVTPAQLRTTRQDVRNVQDRLRADGVHQAYATDTGQNARA